MMKQCLFLIICFCLLTIEAKAQFPPPAVLDRYDAGVVNRYDPNIIDIEYHIRELQNRNNKSTEPSIIYEDVRAEIIPSKDQIKIIDEKD